MMYKSNNAYNLYRRTGDTIVKNIVSLNQNICINIENNITSLVLYIYNLPWCLTYITYTKEFTTICILVFLIYYAHQNVNYKILSSSLNK